jgi:hypothetical protein
VTDNVVENDDVEQRMKAEVTRKRLGSVVSKKVVGDRRPDIRFQSTFLPSTF